MEIAEIIPLYHAKEASIFILFPYKYSNSFPSTFGVTVQTKKGQNLVGGEKAEKH